MNIKGKKLLILGGDTSSVDIVRTAKSMGVYSIVTDYYDTKRSPAKLLADEYWDVSILDYEKLSLMIKEHNVDGVYTSFTDSYLLPYQHLCEINGLPYYASKEAFEKAFDKDKFKQLCRQFDVPTVPQWYVSEFDPKTLSKDNAIIIKPTDSSGARGVTYCDNIEDYPLALQHALDFSPSKSVIIEKFIRNGGTSMSIRYIAIDGEIYLHALGDRYVLEEECGKALITAAAFYPSKHTVYYVNTLDEKVKCMLKSIGIKNGTLFIESFWTNEGIYFYEIGLRLGGAQTYNMTEIANGVNELRMLINYALTGRMCDEKEYQKINPMLNGYKLGSISVPLNKGTISSIRGLDEIRSLPQVYAISQLHKVGDEITEKHLGTLQQLLTRISIVAKDTKQLNNVIQTILDKVSVHDTEGNEMFLSSKVRSIHDDYLNIQ